MWRKRGYDIMILCFYMYVNTQLATLPNVVVDSDLDYCLEFDPRVFGVQCVLWC